MVQWIIMLNHNAHIQTTLHHDEYLSRVWRNGNLSKALDVMIQEIPFDYDGDEWEFYGTVLERLDACRFFLWHDSEDVTRWHS